MMGKALLQFSSKAPNPRVRQLPTHADHQKQLRPTWYMLKMCKAERDSVVLSTSGHKRSRGPPWLDDPMKKSRCQNALSSHSHMGHLGKTDQIIRIILANAHHSPCIGSRYHMSAHNCLWCSLSRHGHAWKSDDMNDTVTDDDTHSESIPPPLTYLSLSALFWVCIT